jgi:hypothetical protein
MKKLITTYEEFVNEAAKFSGDKNLAVLAMQGFSLRDQIHLFHWQTDVGDLHTALGEFYDSFLDQLDGLMEVVMGKYGRISIKGVGSPSPLVDLAGANIDDLLNKYISIFEGYKTSTFDKDDDIKNIIDEIVASINKLKYLITMS